VKRLGVEVRDVKDDLDNIKKVKEIITGANIEDGKAFVPDWGGKLKVNVSDDEE